MVKLADTIDLGSIAQACRFKSCHPHQMLIIANVSCYIINEICESAGIGRQSSLKNCCKNACGFEAHLSYQNSVEILDMEVIAMLKLEIK